MNNKKHLNYFIIILLLLFFFIVNINNKDLIDLKADSPNIRYITTSVGADATSIGINYHIDVTGSYVKYSTNAYFADAEIAYPVEELYSKETDKTDEKTGYPERYICRVNLDNLSENTTYYYQIVSGDVTSSRRSFKTYSNTGTNCDFMFTTDLHSDAGYNTTTKGNTTLTNVGKNSSNINLVIQTGDIVDRGGYEVNWKTFYNGYTYLEDKIQGTIPGNHEYYHTSSGTYVSPEYYNLFFNNPKNGPEERLNSTYTFTYGNIRFIMIDTIKHEFIREQKQWFKEVMENNTSQWVIVGTHSGAISCGAYASDAKWCKENWGPLFEEYQIDLALSGHEHIYIRKDNLYKGETNADLGITYLVGCAGSHKQYSANNTDGYIVNQTNYAANLISVRGDKLTCTLYDTEGKETQYKFQLSAKRPLNTTPMTDDAILKAVTCSYDKANEELNVNWTTKLYGNVSSISIDKTVNDHTTTTTFPIVSIKYLKDKLTPILKDYNYNFTININKKDGTTLTKTFEVVNRHQYNLTLVLNGGSLAKPDDYKIYFDGAFTALPVPIKEGANFIGWHLNEDLSDEAVKSIDEELTGDLTFYAEWEQLYKLNLVTNKSGLTQDPIYLEKNSEYTLPYLNAEGDIFIGWHLNEDLSDSEFFKIKIKNQDITVYGEWASSKQEQPKQEETETQSKKKCGKKSAILLELLSMISLLTFIIRRKK